MTTRRPPEAGAGSWEAAGAACVAAYDALGGLCAQEALEARIDGGWETQPQALPGWRALGGGLWAGPGGE